MPLLKSRVGILKEFLMNQGTPFMSKHMDNLCKLLQIVGYHPQTSRLVERFN